MANSGVRNGFIIDDADDEMDISPDIPLPTTEPSSPQPSSSPVRNPAKRKARAAIIVHSDDETPAPKKAKVAFTDVPPRKRKKSVKKAIKGLPIARSYDECEEHDKRLIDMRDNENKSWAEVAKEWEAITGEKSGTSTLPNRYERLKSNFTIIKAEDNATLIIAKQEIEDEFAEEKWNKIAERMQDLGTEYYHPKALMRQWKKLMLDPNYLPDARKAAKKGDLEEEVLEELGYT